MVVVAVREDDLGRLSFLDRVPVEQRIATLEAMKVQAMTLKDPDGIRERIGIGTR